MVGDYKMQQNLLKQAIITNDLDLFEYLIANDPSLAHEYFNKTFYSPLHLACEFNRIEIVKRLIQNSQVNVNSICQLTGYSPLMYACQVNSVDIVKYLLSVEVNADFFIKSNISGRDARMISIEANFDRVTELLNNAQNNYSTN
eukprot:403374980